jgi:hypothetical protein
LPNNHLSVRKVPKTLAKHISIKVSITLLLEKYMFIFDIRLRLCETSFSSWHISNDDRSEMIVLPLFQLSTPLNSEKT